ncbi:peptidase S41 [Psychroserpens burtonensis]|uniref:Peptidase S41 n=1 Tax=Psychroserpens burtonensis TaxID=49278 RepID=A0A5C7B6P6_9FLAO|nr:S41 family peptidase [Psychroserpens burtonensis]TXE17514.1 peptidase S41 [Psychroserpens burtonensis]
MSKKLILTFGITILLVSCASIEKHNLQVTQLHSVENLHEDIDKAYKQLQRHHPRLYQFTSKGVLDFKFDSLKKAINKPMDSRTFYKQLATVTKHVGQGHLSISPPSVKLNKEDRNEQVVWRFDINYLSFEYLDDTLIVTDAVGKDSVLINAEVLKIENEIPQDLIKKYKNLITADGYNTTFHNRVVGTRFMRYYTYDKGRFDSISLTLKNADSTFIKKYVRRPLRDSLQIQMDSIKRDSLKVVQKTKVKRTKAERKAKKIEQKAKRKRNSKYGFVPTQHMPEVKNYTRSLNFIGKDSTVAIVKIKGFQNGKFEDFYDDTFTIVDSLKTQTLIIDLRNNFGGRLEEIDYLYSYLTDENYTFINKSESNTRFPILKSLMSNSNSLGTKVFVGLLSPGLAIADILRVSKKDGKLYRSFNSSKEQEPKLLNFKGKVYVLINGNSFSASSVLSSQLHGTSRATFVGEETGGAYNGTVAGLFKIYQLPHTKVQVRIGLLQLDTKQKTDIDGYGIKPDVEILPTYQDRLNNIDPELDWILKDIETQK